MKIHTPTITMKLLKQILRMAGGLAAVAMTGTRGLIANMQDSQTTCCKGKLPPTLLSCLRSDNLQRIDHSRV